MLVLSFLSKIITYNLKKKAKPNQVKKPLILLDLVKKRSQQVQELTRLKFLISKLAFKRKSKIERFHGFLAPWFKFFYECSFSVKKKKENIRKHYHKMKNLKAALKKPIKFHSLIRANFNFCRIYLKYTGSNLFGTITNNIGNVAFSYSSGFFKGLNTRKEKTTIFVAKQLGELIALRVYKSNASEILLIPLINHRKARSLIRYICSGFRLVRFFRISKLKVKRKVIRNGVRLKKVARK